MRWTGVILAILAVCTPGAIAQSEALTRAQLHIQCTSNLRAEYGQPAIERRLIGASFIDPDLGQQTRAACERLTARERTPHHLLWTAYARFADQDTRGAFAALNAMAPFGDGSQGRADPKSRAFELLTNLADVPEVSQEITQRGYVSGLFSRGRAQAESLMSLAEQGLLPVDLLVSSLLANQDYALLEELLSGSRTVGEDGIQLGPDLAGLRELADAASELEDPLTAIIWLKRAAGYYGRGFEQQGLVADPDEGLKRLERAFLIGKNTWFEIERPVSYRDAILGEVRPLIERVWRESQDGNLVYELAEAVLQDWAGLRSSQDLDPSELFSRAAELGAKRAQAQVVFEQVQNFDLAPADAILQIQNFAAADPCIYDLWGQAHLAGTFGGAPDPTRALGVFRQGQTAGAAGAYAGEAELHRWARLGQGFDFDMATALFTQGANVNDGGSCGKGAASAAHLNLGWLHFTGQAGIVDFDLARFHFRQAAARGSFHAAEALADIYLFGLGVPRDPILAHEYGTKAVLWNRLNHQTMLAFDFHLALGAEMPGLSTTDQESYRLVARTDAIAEFVEGAKANTFLGTYYLGLAMLADTSLIESFGGQFDGAALLRSLGGHVAAFETAYASQGDVRTQALDAMLSELDGQLNLTFTSARFETQAAIAFDPQRALAFYEALGPDHPTAQKMLTMDRWDYLQPSAQDLLGQGPVTLPQALALGLADELLPIPLSVLLTP